MDSFEMLKRCWERQWAGLGDQGQRQLRVVPFETRGVLGRQEYTSEVALWTASRPLAASREGRVAIILMSVKEDRYWREDPDQPGLGGLSIQALLAAREEVRSAD